METPYYRKALKSLRLSTPGRYIIVGSANTLLNMLLLYLFLSLVSWPHAVSTTAAFALGLVFHYTANRVFTFRTSGKPLPEMRRYLIAVAINYGITLFVVWAALDEMGLSHAVASILPSVVTAASGYVMFRYWVYRHE